MKKIGLLLLSIFMTAIAQAGVVYTGNLINQPALCVDSNTAIDLNAYGIDYSAWQAIYSSTTQTTATFTDGRISTGSVTVASNTNFTNRAATNTITIGSTASLASAKASNSLTVVGTSTADYRGQSITVNGTMLMAFRDWTPVVTATGTAVALKVVLDNFPGLDASVVGAVVYTTAATTGLGGNAYTMSSSSTPLISVATPNFTGGREQQLTNAVLTVNGVAYRNGYEWKSVDTSSGTATAIATFLGHISGIQASAVSTVVYATATAILGSAANAYTIVSSTPTAMVIPQSHFTGGRDTATVTINGTVFTNGVDWTTGTTSSATAKSLSDAIAVSAVSTVITATWTAGGVVNLTSIASGASFNYPVATNNATSLTVNGMIGGRDSSYIVNTPTISVTGHNLGLGAGVLYSTGAVAITGLTNQTTYYVVPVDANSIKLASSKSNALAGTVISLASISTAGQHTFTLAPLATTGSPSFKWQQGNDGTNWSDLNVSSVTFSTPYTATSTFWDLGLLNARYLRISELGPTTGCWNLKVIGNGKQNP